MRDISRVSVMYVKALLLLILGVLAGTLLLLRSPLLSTAVLLAICVWAFARAYYFAFYVIERYIDPSYRFAGLWSCLRYMLRHPKASG